MRKEVRRFKYASCPPFLNTSLWRWCVASVVDLKISLIKKKKNVLSLLLLLLNVSSDSS